MRPGLFLIIGVLFSTMCLAQSDMLILKKNNRTHESFFPGSEMSFSTATRYYSNAYVTTIQRDTVFLVQYDIRQVPTNLGIYVLDTVARYYFGISYHDILNFGRANNRFDWKASGGALFGGGILLTTVGLGTWVFAKPNTRYYARPSLVIGSAVLAGIGYLMLKAHGKGMPIGKKYKLVYIKMK